MTNRYGPRITTDGLVLHLDAANNKSYPGSGNTWYDMSGNGNNATKTGTVAEITYNTNNEGYFDANVSSGSTGFTLGSKTAFNLGNNGAHSVIGIAKFDVIDSYNTILGKSEGINLASPYTWMHVIREGRMCSYRVLNGAGVWYGRSTDTPVNPVNVVVGQWCHLAYCYNGTTLKWYFNGNFINSTGYAYTDNSSHVLYTVASWSSTWDFEGDISVVSLYNRELLIDEVKQNYNAIKGRYGL